MVEPGLLLFFWPPPERLGDWLGVLLKEWERLPIETSQEAFPISSAHNLAQSEWLNSAR